MNYGEAIIKGKSKKEILISTYICHPSMANDNLSGVILTSLLLRFIKNIPNLKWTYRIIFLPETIGPIAYIKKNLDKIKKIDYGINISCVGGKGSMSYKETKDKDSFLNKLVKNLFLKKKLNLKNIILIFMEVMKGSIRILEMILMSYLFTKINIMNIKNITHL